MESKSENNNWLPLESNPDVITSFVEKLGFDTTKYQFHDLLTIEEWGQEMLPKPVLAVIFLFPINKAQKEHAKLEEEEISKSGQIVSPNLFFMKQYAKNACGTVAAFHAIVNLAEEEPKLIKKDSFFEKFIEDTKSLDPTERGNYFKKSEKLEKAHKNAVEHGSTQVRDVVNTHFITFIEKSGFLYEMDGRKKFPIIHGPCTKDELLFKSCIEIKKFMDRDPKEIKFTLIALAPPL